MDTTELRIAFESFAGTDRFNKFVTVFHSHDRPAESLWYWQSKLWSAFLDTYPGVAPSAEDIPQLSSVFNICPLHRVELQTGTATVVNGFSPFEPQLAYARNTQFPFDNLFTYSNLSHTGAETNETQYCPACRDAYEQWIANETLPDVAVCDTFEVKDGRIVVAFDVPFQASHKVVVGIKVLVQPPDRTGYTTRITELERSRDCLNDGSSGLKTVFAIFADAESVDHIPVGTMLSFMPDA